MTVNLRLGSAGTNEEGAHACGGEGGGGGGQGQTTMVSL